MLGENKKYLNLRRMIKFYTGDIEPEEGTIFVFGSNPEGRHGAGSAKVARLKFGAIYGKGEGLQGNSYALPTKDLRLPGVRNIKPDDIVENIKKLYTCARENPNLDFKIAYRNTHEAGLNGYTGIEMIAMFLYAGPIPSNIWVSEEWYKTGLFNDQI